MRVVYSALCRYL
ncbi:unnamed protein product [Arabidopsis thaliana]|uniref:Uncharacterized protein n=2 Tax=Arabidopsis thaliana TaxID=3702 RepID=A0A654FEN9_ARATH|nr:uncharacterized protein AT3G44763 [Arabidopsis thaliana]ANM64468.1 hypothetical protein AT3G44763 [Arabidopsis thaliana]CAA0384499.1 unnamed protein product [Arabidopsis thaliana]VYS59355.1 unnamed protein product [Arabidopsis thaliana]|eukprot:NP_001336524.1 hypothetical protein AT3G44763 [Arabidopsis thaliana]